MYTTKELINFVKKGMDTPIYEFPKGYLDGRIFRRIVAEYGKVKQRHCEGNTALISEHYREYLLCGSNTFAISKPLLKAFKISDIDLEKNWAGFESQILCFCLLMPPNTVLDGIEIEHLLIRAIPADCWMRYNLDSKTTEYYSDANPNAETVITFVFDNIEKVFYNSLIINKDGTTESNNNAHQEIKSIAFQTLLAVNYAPQLITPIHKQQCQSIPGLGFGKKIEEIRGQWLGEKFQFETESNNESNNETRSKRPHLRRGHWRRVAVGIGRSDRRWHYFSPMRIGDKYMVES